ncbi:cadherin [Calothrix parasitica NIES-267]|uniref:Cadherin n=1 Tax=Calothrix parasitica NIES-267 TaxID=1973488 RepID=A0A1Z4LZ99_9CYAN|nr:cadherin [Calothrix parasitica NIES-267]
MSNSKVITLVVIDPAIRDFHLLEERILEGMIPQADVLVLEPNKTEIQQITRNIQKYAQLSDLHIISQGSPGCLYLGNSSLSVHNFNYYAPQLRRWSASNIFLYGCNLGSEEIGKKFILRLYKTTGAKISTLTSNKETHTKVGVGNWTTSEYTSIKSELRALMA